MSYAGTGVAVRSPACALVENMLQKCRFKRQAPVDLVGVRSSEVSDGMDHVGEGRLYVVNVTRLQLVLFIQGSLDVVVSCADAWLDERCFLHRCE